MKQFITFVGFFLASSMVMAQEEYKPVLIECYGEIGAPGGRLDQVDKVLKDLRMKPVNDISVGIGGTIVFKSSQIGNGYVPQSSVASSLSASLSAAVTEIRQRLKLENPLLISYNIIGCTTTKLNQDDLFVRRIRGKEINFNIKE